MANYPLQVVTPKGMRYDGEVESFTVTTTTGQIGILAGHTNYMAAIVIGKAKIIANGIAIDAVCGNGFLSVENGRCTLIANSFDFSDDINFEKVNLELQQAEELLLSTTAENDKIIAKDRIKLAKLRLALIE